MVYVNFLEVSVLSDLCEIGRHWKLIRTAYGLTLSDVADLLNIKSKATIFRIEENRNSLSVELLNKFSRVFSVSFDWLFGVSQNPYIDSYIEKNERDLLFIIKTLSLNSLSCKVLNEIPNEYWNITLRKKHFSLSVRANIVFLLYSFLISYLGSLNNLGLLQDDVLKIIKNDDFLEFDKILLGNFSANFASNQEQLSNLSHLLASRDQDAQPCFSLQ